MRSDLDYANRGTPVMYQRWEDLLFLHWEWDADAIQARLPEGLSVDLYKGKAYIGVVPFRMLRVRPRGLFAVPGLSNFVELNLRTYVRDAEGRPGVWFFSLDACQRIAVWIAQRCFHLPYHYAQMQAAHSVDGSIHFQSQRGDNSQQEFSYRGQGSARLATDESLDHFLVERYRLFAYREKDGQLLTGQVSHAPYAIENVDVSKFSTQLFALNGFEPPEGAPDHSCYSKGVKVSIYRQRTA